jgi:hypothetical protein
VQSKASGYQTTNYCPPTPPEPEPPEPDCKTLKGKLSASLAPEAVDENDEALVPLGTGVLVTLLRKGGGLESPACLENRPRLRSVFDEKGGSIETTAPLGRLTLPLTNSTKFWSLKPGGRISRTIKIGGGCDTVTVATSSRLPTNIKRCTIAGRVVVVIKRLK